MHFSVSFEKCVKLTSLSFAFEAWPTFIFLHSTNFSTLFLTEQHHLSISPWISGGIYVTFTPGLASTEQTLVVPVDVLFLSLIQGTKTEIAHTPPFFFSDNGVITRENGSRWTLATILVVLPKMINDVLVEIKKLF